MNAWILVLKLDGYGLHGMPTGTQNFLGKVCFMPTGICASVCAGIGEVACTHGRDDTSSVLNELFRVYPDLLFGYIRVTCLAYTITLVLKELYFLLYQSKLNITGYRLFPTSPQSSRKSKKLACSTVWYYWLLISSTPHLRISPIPC